VLVALDTKGTVNELYNVSVCDDLGPTITVVETAVARYEPYTVAPDAWAIAVVLDGVTPLNGAAVPRVHPVKVWVLLPVYLIVSFAYVPTSKGLVIVPASKSAWLQTFSITIYPAVGNSDPSVKTIDVAESVKFPFNVVDNSKVETATPPTGCFKSLNLTYDVPAFKPLFGNDILRGFDAAVVVNGLFGKISWTGNSTRAGFACCKACGSAPTGLGSICGCLGSYSDMCTQRPFHSCTISL